MRVLWVAAGDCWAAAGDCWAAAGSCSGVVHQNSGTFSSAQLDSGRRSYSRDGCASQLEPPHAAQAGMLWWQRKQQLTPHSLLPCMSTPTKFNPSQCRCAVINITQLARIWIVQSKNCNINGWMDGLTQGHPAAAGSPQMIGSPSNGRMAG
jgi:hypothetical protein